VLRDKPKVSEQSEGVVLPDHYATLGVPPNSRRSVIRAAYVDLMRRYHPDRNPSAAAGARVRAITAAYAVLSVRDRRARYDLARAKVGVMRASTFMPEQPQWWPWLSVPFGVVVILLLVPLLVPPPLIPPERSEPVLGVGGRQAAAPQEQIQGAAGSNLGALCSTPAAAGLVKRELFRRAARLRGSDRMAFDRLADYSLLRFNSPVLANANQQSGAVSCSASVALDLPPGVATYGDRRSLASTITYSLQAVDGGAIRPSSLSTEGPIVDLLATLAQTPSRVADVVDPSAAPDGGLKDERPELVEWTPPAARPAAAVPATRVEPRRPVAKQNPSFSCRSIRSWAAEAICNSASLAGLDREMASLYGDSMERADDTRRALLVRTDGRFLSRRDGCSSESCVHGAYLARIQEIQGIMASRHPN
jgi:curved DNA-binding protein CbpA